jgi:membrane-associated protein
MDATAIIHGMGYAGLFLVLFAETGLLFGFFLPGDTLLISAGLLAARGELELWATLLVMVAGAVLGDAVGYLIGQQAGHRLYQREESFWFRRSHLDKARAFYARHGGKTIIAARFFTGLRTFAPIVAGAAGMQYRHFAMFNIVGAVGWVVSITLAGYWFGNLVKEFDRWIFIGAVVLLPVPLLVALSQSWRLRRAHARWKAEHAARTGTSPAIDRRLGEE